MKIIISLISCQNIKSQFLLFYVPNLETILKYLKNLHHLTCHTNSLTNSLLIQRTLQMTSPYSFEHRQKIKQEKESGINDLSSLPQFFINHSTQKLIPRNGILCIGHVKFTQKEWRGISKHIGTHLKLFQQRI